MINFLAPCDSQLGYGKVGCNIINTAIRTGKEICYFPIEGVSIEQVLQNTEQQYHENIVRAHNNSLTFSARSASVRLWHQFNNVYHIGYKRFFWPIFELDTFNSVETHHLKQSDKVLVCTKWAKEIIKDKIGVPCSVVTLGVDKEIFKPLSLPNKLGKCIFLNIGKWEKRKGHDILLSLFQKAFPSETNVELWMSCNSPFADNSAWEKYYKQDPRVKIIPRTNTQEELVNLINRATYGIFPSRAEGWGLGMAEMMACGKKCLTTNFSGHTEFCNEQNSYLVNIANTESAVDGIWFHGQGNWAAIGDNEEEQFIEHMRDMYLNRQEHSIDLIPEFNWNRTLAELEDACRC